MVELQGHSIQEISGESSGFAVAGSQFARGAVKRVAHHGMAQRSEMHANLVSPSGIDPQFELRELAKFGIDPPLHRVMRYGFATSRAASCHSRTADAIAADAAGNRAPVPVHPSVDERDVGLLYPAPCKFRGRISLRVIVFGDQHYAP